MEAGNEQDYITLHRKDGTVYRVPAYFLDIKRKREQIAENEKQRRLLNGPQYKILQKDITVYHGGPEIDEVKEGRAFFTTSSKNTAVDYSNKGVLQVFEIQKGSKMFEFDMEGDNRVHSYNRLRNSEHGPLTDAEEEILKSWERDPLRGIAMLAKSRGYDFVKVMNVTDPKGTFIPGRIRKPTITPIDEYIVVNPKIIKKKGK